MNEVVCSLWKLSFTPQATRTQAFISKEEGGALKFLFFIKKKFFVLKILKSDNSNRNPKKMYGINLENLKKINNETVKYEFS